MTFFFHIYRKSLSAALLHMTICLFRYFLKQQLSMETAIYIGNKPSILQRLTTLKKALFAVHEKFISEQSDKKADITF